MFATANKNLNRSEYTALKTSVSMSAMKSASTPSEALWIEDGGCDGMGDGSVLEYNP